MTLTFIHSIIHSIYIMHINLIWYPKFLLNLLNCELSIRLTAFVDWNGELKLLWTCYNLQFVHSPYIFRINKMYYILYKWKRIIEILWCVFKNILTLITKIVLHEKKTGLFTQNHLKCEPDNMLEFPDEFHLLQQLFHKKILLSLDKCMEWATE